LAKSFSLNLALHLYPIAPESWLAFSQTASCDRHHQKTNAKEIPIINYFRWSNKGRNLGQLPTYVKVPVEVSDREILSVHPLVKIWEEVVPYLVKNHPEYRSEPKVQSLYNDIM